jgi:hypothetical protein
MPDQGQEQNDAEYQQRGGEDRSQQLVLQCLLPGNPLAKYRRHGHNLLRGRGGRPFDSILGVAVPEYKGGKPP